MELLKFFSLLKHWLQMVQKICCKYKIIIYRSMFESFDLTGMEEERAIEPPACEEPVHSKCRSQDLMTFVGGIW